MARRLTAPALAPPVGHCRVVQHICTHFQIVSATATLDCNQLHHATEDSRVPPMSDTSDPGRNGTPVRRDIEGGVAFVTGANRGLGATFARMLLEQGAAKVYGGARDPDSIEVEGVVPVRLDITSPADVAAAAAMAGDVTPAGEQRGDLDEHRSARRRRPRRGPAGDGDQRVRHARDESCVRPCAGREPTGGDRERPVGAVVVLDARDRDVLGREGRGVVPHQQPARRARRPGHPGRGGCTSASWTPTWRRACPVRRPAPPASSTRPLDAVRHGRPEVLADDTSRAVRAALSGDLGALYPSAVGS
jgi:hypothetical protein